jgi:endonuclease/exonuclease/phosphatase family metal-dependent hydrolase
MTHSIQVISWNILNPDPDFVKMSLRPVVNQSSEKRNFTAPIYEKSRKLAVINERRYNSQRKPNIIKIIEDWFAEYPSRFVLCLQEVCRDMYDTLLKIYGANRIKTTSICDIKPKIIDGEIVLEDIFDYRCTIISADLEFIESRDIVLQTRESDSQRVNIRKNALYCKIRIGENGIDFDCVNLHFFYTWTEEILQGIFQTIFAVLSQSQRFFLCGDFNKPYERIYGILGKITVNNQDNRLYMPAISNNRQNSFTSFNTRLRNNRINPPSVVNGFLSLQVIDHIIVGNRFSIPENPKIISKIKEREIFYNLSGIETMLRKHKLLNLENKNSNKILEEWQRREFKNISDHKPIIAKINIL